MDKYTFLSQRFYKFFKYTRTLAIISSILALVLIIFSFGNDIMTIISYFLALIACITATESVILFIFSKILKNK